MIDVSDGRAARLEWFGRGGLLRAMQLMRALLVDTPDPEILARIEQDPAQWELLLDWEEEYAREPGALDSGSHLLFAVR